MKSGPGLLRTVGVSLAIISSACGALPTSDPVEDFLARADPNEAVEPVPPGAPPPKIRPPGTADMTHVQTERDGAVIALEQRPIGAVRRATSTFGRPNQTVWLLVYRADPARATCPRRPCPVGAGALIDDQTGDEVGYVAFYPLGSHPGVAKPS